MFMKILKNKEMTKENMLKLLTKMEKSTRSIQEILDSYKGENAVGFGDYTKDIKMMVFENKEKKPS